ncbi:MAG: sigma-54 dependent transcriptional regulator [Blastocatellia bacterium]|nr:sigma-54 dependent transcriptional regulator [Blastocatellia bacterium]
MTKNRILLIEDEAGTRFGIKNFLEMKGYDITCADSCRNAMDLFRGAQPDAVLLDYLLPDGNALDLLPRLKEMGGDTPVIILTGHGSIDLAVRAIKEGADQFLTKPVEMPSLLMALQFLSDSPRPRPRPAIAKPPQTPPVLNPFLGTSAAIRQLAEQARRVVAAESPVLILGETGTGKSVLAGWIHHNSPRADEAFVDLNCAGLSRELLETELFGHEKGAFTGATANKTGLLEVAHHGTVFLDEIGDMDPQIQPKLLKVLEEKRFHRVGEIRDRHVDIRLIAATHQDLLHLVRNKQFRSDLYFRISAIPLVVPSLRDRVEDIPLLAQSMLKKIAAEIGRNELRLSEEAGRALQSYSWPGNIREMRNTLERAALLSEADLLRPRDLRFDPQVAGESWTDGTNLTLQELEQQYIARVLSEEHGNVDRAARRLDVPRSSLYQKIKRFHITPSKI